MDYEPGEALRTILGRRDADKVPTDLAKKIEKHLADKAEEHITVQALYETLQRTSGNFTTIFMLLSFHSTYDVPCMLFGCTHHADDVNLYMCVDSWYYWNLFENLCPTFNHIERITHFPKLKKKNKKRRKVFKIMMKCSIMSASNPIFSIVGEIIYFREKLHSSWINNVCRKQNDREIRHQDCSRIFIILWFV